MKKSVRKAQQQRRRRPSILALRVVKWVALIAGVGLVLYAFSQSAGVAYDEEDIRMIDFSSLSDDQRTDTLRSANRARCTCGCGMNLAQCVATDMTCPIRERNIETIRTMVRDARGAG
jgi:hypothetical protein